MHISPKIMTQFGSRRALPPLPMLIPTNPADALAFASRVDLEADQHLAEGRCGQAERLTHLALEARSRAAGTRA